MSETPTMPGPNKLCPILMIIPSKTGTYGDIVCLGERCQMWREFLVIPRTEDGYEGQPYWDKGCGLAGRP